MIPPSLVSVTGALSQAQHTMPQGGHYGISEDTITYAAFSIFQACFSVFMQTSQQSSRRSYCSYLASSDLHPSSQWSHFIMVSRFREFQKQTLMLVVFFLYVD
jgi:hypothetical protein